jgi:3-phosphoshikimate 1-carboxyvinyltransferase
MHVLLTKNEIVSNAQINICGSKSESNRLLIMQKLFEGIEIQNLSTSQDTRLLSEALSSKSNVIDIHHAGTAMRFLTAYFACQPGRKVTLTGSERMKERPIRILVDALRKLGAEIDYLDKEGFPPLQISGRKLTENKISIDAGVSSQFISALMLIAPSLENGLEITLTGNKTSLPYLQMTDDLLTELGVDIDFSDTNIVIKPFRGTPEKTGFTVESDWSSASYFFNAVAFSPVGASVKLSSFFQKSKQGDAVLPELFTHFGLETAFENDSISIKKTTKNYPEKLHLNLQDTPDLAQTLAVCCFGLNISCELTGLHTLKIKETDRLQALKNEISKLGGTCEITDSSLVLKSNSDFSFDNPVSISTYNDHRMAMAFATLSFLFPIKIENKEVVEKSYPEFWLDFKKLGIDLTPVK